ncbi:galactose-1-phosphate uridylyltransferase [Betaproteobacteria bacterium]|nr:galactose-1-phosphate uridylyltransferase [Betaproteobacteria bacterium]
MTNMLKADPRDEIYIANCLRAISENHEFLTDEQISDKSFDLLTPLPSEIADKFYEIHQTSASEATDYFYGLMCRNNYVKTEAIAKNRKFSYLSKYGKLEITINLSKPEKDPKAIAAALSAPKPVAGEEPYPKCQLCWENEGYFGRHDHPSRSNLRIVPVELGTEHWGFQYSPYAYYDEHAIMLNVEHIPMKIDRRAFTNLLLLLDFLPHYMFGSNSDIPIVGGSILAHDHYQGGRHVFPMMKAKVAETFKLNSFPEINAGIVNWPMTVLRLESANKDRLVQAATQILEKWKRFSLPAFNINAGEESGVQQHHTITPIAYKSKGASTSCNAGNGYTLDLVLRDNNVSDEYPDGIFHPHKEKHHIKKENIGLIEVMGLAILPPRLDKLVPLLQAYLDGTAKVSTLPEEHRTWAKKIKDDGETSAENAIGVVFEAILEDAGVFKWDNAGREGLRQFIEFMQ